MFDRSWWDAPLGVIAVEWTDTAERGARVSLYVSSPGLMEATAGETAHRPNGELGATPRSVTSQHSTELIIRGSSRVIVRATS